MRVLVVNKHARVTGGADVNALMISKSLRVRGHEVAWVSTSHPDNEEAEGIFVRLRVTHGERDRLPLRLQAVVASEAIWSRAAARGVRELCRSFKPDVVHVHKLHPHLSVSPVVIAALAGVPVVQTAHDYEFISASPLSPTGGMIDREDDRLRFRALNTATFAIRRLGHVPRVARWIAASNFVAARLHETAGVEPVVIPYPVEMPPDVVPSHQRSGLIFVGRLVREKGLADVVELARAVPEETVTVIGGGPLAQMLLRVSRDLPQIRYLGELAHADALREVSTARVAVVPSRWQEPAGQVALEAMAAGTPVVAYRSGGLAEYVGDGAGIVIEPCAETLAEAVRRILRDSTLWTNLSRGGRDRVREGHDPASYMTRIEDVYASAAGA